jgi:hypothetical protein
MEWSRVVCGLSRAAAGRCAVAVVLAGAGVPASFAADPAPSLSFEGTVDMTGAVVEGTVTGIAHFYSESAGPRTHITLSSVKAHAGQAPGTVVLDVYGGPLPDGTFAAVADEPHFIMGKKYVVFLSNRPWRVSPVVRRMAFRVEGVGGKEVLVSNDGRPAREVTRKGIAMGRTALFKAVGPLDTQAPTQAPAPPRAQGTVPAPAAAPDVTDVPSVREFVAGLRRSFPELDRADRPAIRLKRDASGDARPAVAAKALAGAADSQPDPTIPAALRRGN